MTEQPDRGSRLIDLARQEANAALAVLLDPATNPASAETHILEGWRLMFQGAEVHVDPADTTALSSWIRRTPTALSEHERSKAADLVTDLASRQALPPLERSAPRTPRELTLNVRGLQKVIDGYEPLLRPPALIRRNWLRRALATAAALAVLIAFLLTIQDKTDLGMGPWRGDYYPTHTFEGKPILRRDNDINFNWKREPPDERISADLFSMRWDTCLVIAEDTKFHFLLTSDDGSKLYVDGEPLIDMWKSKGRKSKDAPIDLEAGVHHLRLDYFEGRGSAMVTLEAAVDDQKPGPIPGGILYYPGDVLNFDDVCHAVKDKPSGD